MTVYVLKNSNGKVIGVFDAISKAKSSAINMCQDYFEIISDEVFNENYVVCDKNNYFYVKYDGTHFIASIEDYKLNEVYYED